ncbi:hypothetical protein CDD83_10602 [Cordyceps sp. RAO-2017]|nr:hypothetical protein CDD83_10602 [Cordyceps sp. RAO-2017]
MCILKCCGAHLLFAATALAEAPARAQRRLRPDLQRGTVRMSSPPPGADACRVGSVGRSTTGGIEGSCGPRIVLLATDSSCSRSVGRRRTKGLPDDGERAPKAGRREPNAPCTRDVDGMPASALACAWRVDGCTRGTWPDRTSHPPSRVPASHLSLSLSRTRTHTHSLTHTHTHVSKIFDYTSLYSSTSYTCLCARVARSDELDLTAGFGPPGRIARLITQHKAGHLRPPAGLDTPARCRHVSRAESSALRAPPPLLPPRARRLVDGEAERVPARAGYQGRDVDEKT